MYTIGAVLVYRVSQLDAEGNPPYRDSLMGDERSAALRAWYHNYETLPNIGTPLTDYVFFGDRGGPQERLHDLTKVNWDTFPQHLKAF